jgi:hypothetical protein
MLRQVVNEIVDPKSNRQVVKKRKGRQEFN